MAYRQTKGAYYSHVTKRTYQFKEGDPSDQRRAKSQMQNDDSVFQQAEKTRIANQPPDTRTRAEIIRSETVHRQRPTGDAGAALSDLLADLQTQLSRARTTSDRNRLQRAIDGITPRLQQHEDKVQAAAERQAKLESKEVQAALSEAQELLDLYRFRPDVAQNVVTSAEAALNALKETLDVPAFVAAQKDIRARHNIDRQRQIAELKAQIAERESQLFTVAADEAPPEATAPEVVTA